MPSIFITGGGSGIGRATAQRFAQAGWFVGIGDINEAGMAETAALLPEGRRSTHRLDVRDRTRWAEVLENFARQAGGLTVLMNNAGVGVGGPIDQPSDEEVDLLIDVNFRGVVNGIRAALPLLREAENACILNTCSASGIYGSAGLSIYSATKFAVRGLTEALDIELASQNIRVRDLMPGFIDTPLLDRVVPGSNETSRDRVRASGLEFTPVEKVAETAWRAVQSDRVHHLVGRTPERMAFAARWMPGRLRRELKQRSSALMG